ncbi:ABC transporter substrate-binding protein [Streptomyces sp. NBC_01218]|uniref:ABC transporter substrate-binding protein n=1 Tax=Streptomyces sp. NBC_01218 TaxID=2903780 RepID=UPI002E14B9D5|nr:ABC transporter substrate-binding protein [Streptomyces sp. NBC_01218]
MTGRRHAPPPLGTFGPLGTRRLLVGAAAAGSLLLSGCGALPGAEGGAGGTVTVMTWAPGASDDADSVTMAGVTATAVTYAKWVNVQGGVGGRELKVLTCDEEDSLEGAEKCAREAVDRDVTAVVGSYSRHGQTFMAPLEAAGIPYIGGYGASDEEFESFVSYPVNGGQAALLAGNGRQLAGGCAKVSLVRPDSVVGDDMATLLDAGLALGHRAAATDVVAPVAATSYDAEAAEALDGAPDGCVTAVLGDRTGTFFDSFRRLPGNDGGADISSVLGSVSQPLIDSTGGRDSPFEGAFVTGWYPVTSDARWAEMREAVRKYAFADDTIDPHDAGVQTTWVAYTVLKAVVEALGDGEVDAAAATSVLNHGLAVDTGGLTPELRWRYQDMLGSAAYPRIVNGRVTFQVVRDGRLVSQKTGFTDVTETLSDAEGA